MTSGKWPRARTAFDENYSAEVFAQDVSDEEQLVQQHMAEECDVNNIMRKYERTGQLTHIVDLAGEYGDFSDVLDYKSGLERIIAADSLFMELPASVRDRFGNDPANFVDFAINPENIEELRTLGLAPPAPQPPEPQLVKVVGEPEGGPPPSK